MKNLMMLTSTAISLSLFLSTGSAKSESDLDCEIALSSSNGMIRISALVTGNGGDAGEYRIYIRTTSGANTAITSQQGNFQIDETGRSVVAQSLLGLSSQQRLSVELSGIDQSGQRSFSCTSSV